MGKLVGRITEGNVLLSVFENEAVVEGEVVAIPNIKIDKTYTQEGVWKKTNHYRERDLDKLIKAIQRYYAKDFDKPKSDNDSNGMSDNT